MAVPSSASMPGLGEEDLKNQQNLYSRIPQKNFEKWLRLHLHLCLVLEKWSSRISRLLYFSIHQEKELVLMWLLLGLQMLLLREGTETVQEIQVR